MVHRVLLQQGVGGATFCQSFVLHVAIGLFALCHLQRPLTSVYLVGHHVAVVVKLVESLRNDGLRHDAHVVCRHRQLLQSLQVGQFANGQRIVVILQYRLVHICQEHDAPFSAGEQPALRPLVHRSAFRHYSVTLSGDIVPGHRCIVLAARHLTVWIEHHCQRVVVGVGINHTHPAGVIILAPCQQVVDDGQQDVVLGKRRKVKLCPPLHP